jgi:CBS domain containing-hemolysin-like protein
MTIARWILTIPVNILNRVGISMLRLFRVPPAEGHERVLSPEELELIVTESTEGGLLNVEEQEMILNIFDFSDRSVAQVMTPRTKVEAIPLDVSRQEILNIVTDSRHSRFPVYDGDRDHIVGILHLKDLVRQTLRTESKFDLRLILRSAPAVPEDLPVQTLLAAFKRQKLHMAIVLDEFGGMDGIVTLEDLVEEVVGEVRDEFDQEKEPYVEISPGVIEAEGEYLVDDFEDGFWGNEEDLPDVETVGGLVISKLGRPPKIGDEVTYNEKIQIRVLAIEGRAVSRVLVEFPDPNKQIDEETAVAPDADGE